MRTSDVCPTCSTNTNALCVVYNGPLLDTLQINTLDTVEDAIKAMEDFCTDIGTLGTGNLYTTNGTIPNATNREVTIPTGSSLRFIASSTSLDVDGAVITLGGTVNGTSVFDDLNGTLFLDYQQRVEIYSSEGIRLRNHGTPFYHIFTSTAGSVGLTAEFQNSSGTIAWTSDIPTQLSDLSDVTTVAYTAGHVLIADGTDYDSRLLVEADISDLQSYLINVVEDITPQLGGNLDVQANQITTSTVNGNIVLLPNGTGNVEVASDINLVNSGDNGVIKGNGTTFITYTDTTADVDLGVNGGLVVESTGVLSAPNMTTGEIDTKGNSALITKEYGDANYTNSGGTELLDEGNGDGLVIVGRDAASYGNIGSGAFDVSIPSGVSATRGATAAQSFAAGLATTASGIQSVALGRLTEATGEYSFAVGNNNTASQRSAMAFGQDCTASGFYSFVGGFGSEATGDWSVAFGNNTVASGEGAFAINLDAMARSWGETALGSFNTDYTPTNAIDFNAGDRALVIGNGVDNGNRHDAFTVLKNGQVGIDIDNFEANTNGKLLQVNGTAELQKSVTNDITTAYELTIDDKFGIVTMNNAGANTLTIPANSSVAFPIGTEIVIINIGAGTTTVAITTDTLNQNVGGLTLAQYDRRLLTKITATSWIMS